MAEPQPNYLSGVNQARQAGRTARRKRTEDMLTPLDSAAAMDRLQGVDVGDFSGVMDTPSVNIIPALIGNRRGGGGGGYSSPQEDDSDEPQDGYITQVGCPNGQCGVRSYAPMAAPTTVYSTPSSSTVYSTPMSSPMATTVSSPVVTSTTTSAKPAKPMTLKERGEAMVNDGLAQSGSIPYDAPDSQPARAALATQDARLKVLAGERMLARDAREKADEINKVNTGRMLDQQDIQVAADAAEKYSQAKVNDATAAMAQDGNSLDYHQRMNTLLRRTIEGGESPADYAAARLVADTNTMAKPNLGRGEPGAPPTILQPNVALKPLDERYREYLRIGTAGHAIHMFLQSSQFHERMTARPSDEVRMARTAGMVGKDNEGKPVEFNTDQLYDPDFSKTHNEALRRSTTAIANGYGQSGLLGQSWYEVSTALNSDVLAPLQKFVTERYITSEAGRIAKLPEEAQADAIAAVRDRASNDSLAYFRFIEADIAIANAKAGGGTPLNPKGTAQSAPAATTDWKPPLSTPQVR